MKTCAMVVPANLSGCSLEEFRSTFSFKRFCFFVFIFILILGIGMAVSMLITILALKPQEPKFFLQKVRVDSYNLDAHAKSSTLLVSAVVSLVLKAQNHNKFGIRYSASRLNLYHKGIPIGVIRVPGFDQPAHSENVSVSLQLSLPSLNVSQILDERLSPLERSRKTKLVIPLTVSGNIRVRLRLPHLNLPHFKVRLACDMDLDYTDRQVAPKKESFTIYDVHDHDASFPLAPNSESFYKKCTLSPYL